MAKTFSWAPAAPAVILAVIALVLTPAKPRSAYVTSEAAPASAPTAGVAAVGGGDDVDR